MGQGMSVLVIFPCEPLNVIIAGRDWALLRSLGLVGQTMGLEVLENLSAVWVVTSAFFGCLGSIKLAGDATRGML